MSTDSIIDAYHLKDVTVSPDKLLLDPKNPRIVLKIDRAVDYTLQQLASDEVQNYIFSVVNKAEFHVNDLIQSIRQTGFLDHGSRMIIEHVDGTGKYLVIEGNRRLTAIKHLLCNPSVLPTRVIESLKSIKVYELVLTDDKTFDRDEIISKILGMLHLKGQLEWGAMERAYYIYKSYMFEVRKDYGGFAQPNHDTDYLNTCAKTFEMKPQEIVNELNTYLVYSQLREQGYAVEEDHYTLINLAVCTRGMKYDYFELDWNTFQLSSDGLERFNKLCLGKNPPVHNPVDFKKVAKVYKNGNEHDMELIETRDSSIEDVIEMVDNRLAKHEFLLQVEKIEKKMSSLRLIAPAGLNKEVQLVTKIRDIANQILRSFQ